MAFGATCESSTKCDEGRLSKCLPIRVVLPWKGSQRAATIDLLPLSDPASAPTIGSIHKLLNYEIVQGNTYPFEKQMERDAFFAFYCPGVVLAMRWDPSPNVVHSSSKNSSVVLNVEDPLFVGSFFIKPNYPGRSSHICLGGFLVMPQYRGCGMGTKLGEAFLRVAPLLGYRGAVFNLVYRTNVASIKTWQKLGFKQVGIIPGAGRLAASSEFVDGVVFYYDFIAKPKL